jgi:hypothetical protein
MKVNINEELTDSDLTKRFKIFLDSKEFENKIGKIVKDKLKNEKDLEDKMVEITKNVITQLYKTLWVKRNVWQSSLKNKGN